MGGPQGPCETRNDKDSEGQRLGWLLQPVLRTADHDDLEGVATLRLEDPRDLLGSIAGNNQGQIRWMGAAWEQRRRVLNDALLFATARKYGCAVLSRNVRDFDLLQQLDPSGKVMFYK
jgi:predicted nucleic acid-binding protein